MPCRLNKRVIRSCKSRNRQNTKKTNNCWQTLHRKQN